MRKWTLKSSHLTGCHSRVSWGDGPGWSADQSNDHTSGTWRAFPCCGCCECDVAGWRRCWMSGRSIYTCRKRGGLSLKQSWNGKNSNMHKLLVIIKTERHNESGTCGLFCGKHNGIHNVGHTYTFVYRQSHQSHSPRHDGGACLRWNSSASYLQPTQ